MSLGNVLDTVPDNREEGPIVQWDKWYQHPSIHEYKGVLLSDQKQKANVRKENTNI